MQRLHNFAFAALVIAYALGPMATQMLTPAVPFVQRDFAISMAAAQSLVSLAFAVIAVMTLVYGPLADRYGRRPVILAGTSLFCAGSLLAAFAPTPEAMVLGRMVQAAGSAAGLTLARTVIHDVYGRERSGEVIAGLTTVMIFVPMVSPAVGGVLLDSVGWRALFGVCLLLGLVALTLLTAWLPETRAAALPAPGLAAAFAAFGPLLRDRNYLAPALFFSCIMAAIFATQAALPYLVVEVLGGSATEYGAWFAIACAFYVAGNAWTGRHGQRHPRRMLMLCSGAACLAIGVAGLVVAHLLPWSTALVFVPAVALYFAAALAIAPVQAEALAAQPACSGAASGLLSGMQMAAGAIVVQLMGFAHDGTPFPMLFAVAACALSALACVAAQGAPLWRREAAALP